MSNIFANKKGVSSEKVEDDFLGGGGVLDTDIYSGTIKYAYIGKSSKSEARCLNLSILVNGTHEVARQIWMTNGKGEVTYKDKKTGEEKNLPGYNQVNGLAMLLLSKEVGELDVEEKTLKLYDFDAKKELPQAVECFVELHGVDLQVAIQRQTVDKTENDGNGNYKPTGETREVNEFIKFFPAERLVTISEVAQFVKSLGGDFNDVLSGGQIGKAIANMEDDGDYATKWLDRNRGQIYDKSTAKKGSGGKDFKGSVSSSGGEKKKSASLFDD